MTSRIEFIEAGDASNEKTNELLREAEEGWYGDVAFFGAMAHQPTLLERLMETFKAFPQSDTIDTELLELMRLRVAEKHKCTYCATVRTQEVKDDVVPKEDAIFGDEIDPEPLTRREELAVQLVDYLSENPHQITDAFFDKLRNEFTDAELTELLLFGSLEVGLDRFTIALELDTAEDSPYPSGLDYPFERSPTDET